MFLLRSALAAAVALVTGLTGCSSTSSTSGATYTITSSDTACDVEKTDLPAGDLVFNVENTGSDVTEVYVYGEQGGEFSRILGEVENIGPGTSRDFTVSLASGDYQVACKPGMSGDGIRTDVTVTGASDSSAETGQSEAAYDRGLEFSVAAGGSVEPPTANLTATSGEKIEFKLHNDADEEHYLELLDPAGTRLGVAAAAAEAEAEFVAELPAPGDYTVSIYADGEQDSATAAPLTVSD